MISNKRAHPLFQLTDADSKHLSAAAYECCPPDYPRCSRNDTQTFSQLPAVGRHLVCSADTTFTWEFSNQFNGR